MAKTSTSFKKGEAKGRPKGAVNQLTKTVRDTVMVVFNNLQSDPRAKCRKLQVSRNALIV